MRAGEPTREACVPKAGASIYAPLNARGDFSRINAIPALHPQRSKACLKVVTMFKLTVRE